MLLKAGITSSDAVNIAKTSGSKSKAAGGAAGMFVVSGLCSLAATSWAASKIIKNNDFNYFPGANVGGGKVMFTQVQAMLSQILTLDK